MILCLENSKESRKKVLEPINKFSKATGYRINTQTSVVFLYTYNEQSKKEIKKAFHL